MAKDWRNFEEFYERFDGYLNSEGYSHSVFAQLTGIDEASISRLRRGRNQPSYGDTIDKLFKTLGSSITLQLLYQVQNSGCGISWIEPAPIYHPGISLDEAQEALKTFRALLGTGDSVNVMSMRKYELLAHLKLCLFSHVVQITDVARDHQLGEELKNHFGLKHCVVADVQLPASHLVDSFLRAEAIAFLAVTHILETITLHNCDIGVTGGTPIYRFVDLLPASTERLVRSAWWSLISTRPKTAGGAPTGTEANDVLSRVAFSQTDVLCYYLPFLHPEQFEQYRESVLSEESRYVEALERVRNQARHVKTVIMSVGSSDFMQTDNIDPSLGLPALKKIYDQLSPEDQAKCVGDILLRLVDINGNVLGDEEEYRKFVYSIDLSDLRRTVSHNGDVWILAEREDKAEVVYAAITSGVANSLIIDRSIALKLRDYTLD